jgi:type III restriction enzyme
VGTLDFSDIPKENLIFLRFRQDLLSWECFFQIFLDADFLFPCNSDKFCLNVNEEDLDKKSIKKEDEEEVINQQNLLNSLEEKNNKIRVIFAVQKLNEGWDVLNLYDIVRISDKQASGGGTIGGIAKTTISEAQLVGRGVRYFPFKLESSQRANLRKYDEEAHDLRILEELYFHCHPGDKGRYIAELKKAFEREGLGETELEDKDLKIKESFKKTSFYKTAKIYINNQILSRFVEKRILQRYPCCKRRINF